MTDIRLSAFMAGANAGQTVDRLVERAASARAAGLAGFWMPQAFGPDALTALALVGREVPDLELGSAVVPIQLQHVAHLALQATTAQGAAGGRLVLGIGVSHAAEVEGRYGLPFVEPVEHMEEYLTALRALLAGGAVDVAGRYVTVRMQIERPPAPVPLLVGALGPRMLRLAGRLADGTITWMTGPRTLAAHTVPTITAAAAGANRPSPRIVAALPVCVTEDVAAARALASRLYGGAKARPSYRRMLDREGVADPGDLAIVGDATAIGAALERLETTGITDLVAVPFGSAAEKIATIETLGEFA